MPGSQTELAVVTADFVKVYDLGSDVLSPQYFFLVPSGKVRDCTLAFTEDGQRHVLVMSSAGHIYYQSLTTESLATNGPFYVTNIMDVDHADLRDNNSEQIGGGGVSIFYCHALRLLFFSYVHGKSFLAPMPSVREELTNVTRIDARTTSAASPVAAGGKGSPQQQPLCQWAEVLSHPGLITAFFQTSNNPVIIMIKPDAIHVQELKVGILSSYLHQ